MLAAWAPRRSPPRRPGPLRHTAEFTERAHVGRLHDHTHRMGMLLAARTSTLTGHFRKKAP
ncbi:hypothetical protein EF908_12735 [Streptomyces sp. WAC04770]|nr:hypothetical protein [Streptomyces sp. WAC04770]RST23110.1 hypothetical protein EF908_12735 [Streptomyces sp. WAC04770]